MKKLSLNKNFLLDIIRTTVIAVIISLLLVLVLALVANLIDMSDKIIKPINEAIKIVSVFVGCFIGFKDMKTGAFKGALCGLLYTFLAILIFGIISKSIKFNMLSLVDIALGIVAGVLSGIIVVNVKRKKQ